MDCRTYQAFSMADALAAVKQDLGEDAVILNTRSFKRGGVMGLGRQNIVEVTATRAATGAGAVKSLAPRPAKTAAHVRAAMAARPPRSNMPATSIALQLLERTESASQVDAGLPARDEHAERVRRLTQAAASACCERGDGLASEERGPLSIMCADEGSATPGAPIPRPPVLPLATRRFVLSTPGGGGERAESEVQPGESRDERPVAITETLAIAAPPVHVAAPAAVAAAAAVPSSLAPPTDPNEMQRELLAIRDMVGQVLQQQSRRGPGNLLLPQQLFEMYRDLIAQDVSDELADTIVNEVRGELNAEQLENAAHVRRAVLRRLAAYVPVAEEAVAAAGADGRPLTIALVGPTGVGKTTTLAKLAAAFKLHHGKDVGVITADTYRIAAVDQLRTYTNIIGLPLEVALTPAEMQRAAQRLSDRDVILIDTAGRSQNDVNRISELKQFIDAADPHEVHLVLSSTASEKVLLQEAEAFSAVGVDKVVLTKLDEAVSFGVLINVVRRIGKQLSFFSTGQEVPDDLEVGRSHRLAELVLGGAVSA